MRSKETPYTDDQRRVLELDREHPAATPKDIAEMMGDDYPTQYCKRIIEDFELPDEHRTIGTIATMATVSDNTTDETEPETETEPEEGGSEPVNEEIAHYESRPLDSLGHKAQAVVKAARNGRTLDDIADDDEINTSRSYVRRCIKQGSQFIDDDARIWDDVLNPRTVLSVDDIAEADNEAKQKIVQAICDNPDKNKEKIADIADSNANHVGSVMQMYEHLLPSKFCKRYPSLSDGGKYPRHRNAKEAERAGKRAAAAKHQQRHVTDDIEQDAMDEAEAIVEEMERNEDDDDGSVSIGAEPATESEETEEPSRPIGFDESLFDEDGNLRTRSRSDDHFAQKAEQADKAQDAEPPAAGLPVPDPEELSEGRVVADEDVERLLEEAEAVPQLNGEMRAYAAGIQRAVKALGLDN